MKIRFAPSRANADFEQLPKIIFLLALGWVLSQLAIALFEYFRLATAAVAFPFPLDFSEGPILDQVLRLAHFENIYRNTFATPPYTVTNNPPLFHILQAPVVRLFGPAFWYGRLISILSALAAAGMIGLLLHAVTADWVASAISALAFLAFPYDLRLSVPYEPPSELIISVRWTQAMRDAIYAHYKTAQKLDWAYIYLPNNRNP